ncbi:MAG: LPS O-antigen length regulator [Legionellales bacterium]|nr:LPS O-antigen length regulator [Legionellales bacterium]
MTAESFQVQLKKQLNNEDEIDLRDLFMALWQGKLWIIGITIIAAALSVAFALSQPNIYRAEALLVADQGGSSGLANLAAQYGGLAGLAGISLPAGEIDKKAIGIAKLRSHQFIAKFVQRHDILPDLMAVTNYDSNTGELGYNLEIYDPIAEIWISDATPSLQAEPSLQEASTIFQGILGVTEDFQTGFVSISIEHISPIIAYQWATWLVDDLNQEMMLEAVDEAQQSINYLTEQLASTQVVALEQVFYSLIEEQMKTIMLANSRSEYLFKTIDPAIVEETKAGPNRAFICILGTLFGGILGVIWALVRRYAFSN